MIKFNQNCFEVFGYTFHCPKFAPNYVRENGVYLFSTVRDNIKVEIQLSTGNTYCMNDYDFPNPNYEVEWIKYDDEIISLDYVKDDDYTLYESICDIVNTLSSYSQSVEDYTFNCEGYQESNFNDKLTCEYDNLDLKNYIVIDCNIK